MKFRTLALSLVVTLSALPSFAAGAADANPTTSANEATPSFNVKPTIGRPAVLPTLYVSLAGLQAADCYLTLSGLSHGATEANPVVQGLTGSPTSMWVMKAASTASSIYLAERLWRRQHRVAAVAVMAISNSVMIAVAAHNSRVLNAR